MTHSYHPYNIQSLIRSTTATELFGTHQMMHPLRMARGRVVLIGKGAQSIGPAAGDDHQSVNCDIEDAIVLSKIVQQISNSPSASVPDALLKFETLRKARREKIAQMNLQLCQTHTLTSSFGIFFRNFMYSYLPTSLTNYVVKSVYGYKPTIQYIPDENNILLAENQK